MASCSDVDAALAGVSGRLAALEASQAKCCATADDALVQALKALKSISDILSSVSDIFKAIADILNVIKGIKAVTDALSPLVGSIGTILNLLLTIGTLSTLGARIDAVEAGLTALGNEVGNNYQKLFLKIQTISLTPGATGATGANGAPGRDGKNGTNGINGIKGKDGVNGRDGANGKDGKDGKQGLTGATGATGKTGLTGANGAAGAAGLTGKPGATGASGSQGLRGLTGATGATGIPGRNGINGTNGKDGLTGAKGANGIQGIQGVPGKNGTNGINGKDGVDKGMNCIEMQACLAPQTAALATIAAEQVVLGFEVAAIGTELTAFIVADTIAKSTLLAEVLAGIATANNIYQLAKNIYDLLNKQPAPPTLLEITDLIDGYFPGLIGNFYGTMCDGTKIQQSYNGKGLIGLQRMYGAGYDVQASLLRDICQNTNLQGFVNTTICGKPYTGTFRGAIEGIQRLGDLIGFAVTENCKKVDDLKKVVDDAMPWKAPEFKPYMKEILDPYFPIVSGRLESTLCNGTTIAGAYSGQGLNGINSAIAVKHQIDSARELDYLQCIITEIQRALSTEFKYSGIFSTQKCDGSSIVATYNGVTIENVLETMFSAIEQKIDDLCDQQNTYQTGTVTIQGCKNTYTPSWGGQGVTGINEGLLALGNAFGKVVQELCTTGAANVVTTNVLPYSDCVSSQSVTYTSTSDRAAIDNGIRALANSLKYSFEAICKALDVPISGEIELDDCPPPTTPVNPPATPTNPLDDFINSLLNQVIDGITAGIIAALPLNAPAALAANLFVKLFLENSAKNLLKDALTPLFGSPANLLPPANASFPTTPILLDASNPNGIKYFWDANKTYKLTYNGNGLIGIDNEIKALSQQIKNLTAIACEPRVIQQVPSIPPAIDCDPLIIEPTERYREALIETQACIWFYPVGTKRSERKNSLKWHLYLPNPRPGLTCADFAPLTWQRGKWYSKIRFASGAISTSSYFFDYDGGSKTGEAIDKMQHLASLSQIPLINPIPRVTDTNSTKTNLPNQPIMEVQKVFFVTYDANGQKTNVSCLLCVP